MLRLKRLIVVHHPNGNKCEAPLTNFIGSSRRRRIHGEEMLSHHPSQRNTYRFLDIFQFGNKAAIEKERARISDEMNRGYFADIAELKKHGGKTTIKVSSRSSTEAEYRALALTAAEISSVCQPLRDLQFFLQDTPIIYCDNISAISAASNPIEMASKTVIPAMQAVKFPSLEVNGSDGKCLKLPDTFQESAVEAGKTSVPRVSLLCLSFRASSQEMINSWSVPFADEFSASRDVQIYEVSFIESWFLSLSPIKRLLLKIMRKSNSNGKNDALERKILYSFGDQYYFRKELKILNLLTGYIYLLDKFGRIRWQGFGFATEEELKTLLSSVSIMLEEK